MADRAARRVLEAWIDRLRPASEALARARWEAACAATPSAREQVESAAHALDELSHDDTGFARVEQSLSERIDDPLLRRALERLRLRLLPHSKPRPEALVALEADVQERFATFRAVVGETQLSANEVFERLRGATDGDVLESTWRAAARVGAQVAPQVRELAHLRNEHADAVNGTSFRALRLETEEVIPAALDAFLLELENGTNDAWQATKADLDARLATRYGIEGHALRPWHYGDVFLQALPPDATADDPLGEADGIELTRATFAGLDLDVAGIFEASDLRPRPGKIQHAFCTHLDRQGDIRVLANVVPGERWTRTMLHEFGHAAYDRYLDQDLPWNLITPPHAAVTEGVAMLFGRLVEDPHWRRDIAGLPPDPAADTRRRASLLAFVRWGLVMCRFEERLYEDPDADLDEVWWSLVERLQGIPRPDPLPRDVWAAKIHIACWPVYYHSYLLGECIASQLSKHIHDDVFGRKLVGNKAAGAFLKERVFLPSAAPRWERLVEEATGMPLSAQALLADVLPASQPG